MSKKIAAFTLFVSLVIISLVACSADESDFIGIWEMNPDSDERPYTDFNATPDFPEYFELFSDGTGVYDDKGYSVTWIAEKGRIKFDAGILGSDVFSYEISRNKITLSSEGYSITYNKKI